MKHIIQKDINDCGIACICMLLEHDFGINLDYQEVRNNVEIEEKGIRLDNLVNYLCVYDKYKAYECKIENLPNYPFITIVNLKKKYNHYIIVWKKDDKYIYYSNPAAATPEKISLQRFKKIYSGIIIYFKEKEIEKLSMNNKLKIKGIKKYLLPLITLNIIELLAFIFSLLYLFNIEEFNILKIAFFFAILTLQIIIYLLKNHMINQINYLYEDRLVDNVINEKTSSTIIKDNVKKGYYLMNKKNIYYNKIIPYFVITTFAFILFFYIHYLLFVCVFIFASVFFIIESYFYKKKNKYSSKCAVLEEDFNNADCDIKIKLKNIKKILKTLSKINMSEVILNLFYRQVLLIFIMLFFSLINQEQYVFIGVYLCFYLFDGISVFAEYNSDKQRYKYIIHSYNQDCNK